MDFDEQDKKIIYSKVQAMLFLTKEYNTCRI